MPKSIILIIMLLVILTGCASQTNNDDNSDILSDDADVNTKIQPGSGSINSDSEEQRYTEELEIENSSSGSEVPDEQINIIPISEEEAESKIKLLIYYGIIDDGSTYANEEEFNNLKLDVEFNDNSYIITLANDRAFTMDKDSGIVYCIKNQEENICDQAYLTYLDGGIIVDTDSFSCVPGEPKAAADDSGMKCFDEIINKYNSLKADLVSRRQN